MRSKISSFVVAAAIAVAFAACGGRSPLPLVSEGHLCELDTHCPAGSHCVAGVCQQDCRVDEGCPLGQSCDPRGRCLLPAARPAPPKILGHLVEPPPVVSLSPGSPSGSLTLGNDGSEALQFHLLSDDPAVIVTPTSGSIAPGESADVQIHVEPSFSGRSAVVHVLTTGGGADVGVDYDSPLAGRLEGTVTVTSPYALGDAPFALELAGAPGALAGAVDGHASLLWPVSAAATGTDDGTHFQASFAFVAAPGDPANPLLDVSVQRTVTLAGTHQGAGAVSGSYVESILGLPGGAVTASGSFSLHRVGASRGLTPAPAPAFAPAAPSALPPADCVGGGAGCAAAAAAHFQKGFPFEAWAAGWQFSGGSCLNQSGEAVSCVVPAEAALSLADAAAAGTLGQPGLLDVLRAQASYGLLSGKDALAQVLQPAGGIGSPSLDADMAGLSSAAQSLGVALHSALGGSGLFASGNYALVRAMPAAAFAAASEDCLHGDDLAGFGGAVAARLFADAQALDRIERGAATAALGESLAQSAASGALLDLAALGALLPPVAGATPIIDGLADAARLLTASFSRLGAGLNPAGFHADEVPFLYDPSQPTLDLFQQVAALATKYVGQAQQDEAALQADTRDFDQQATALGNALQGIAQAQSQTVTELCGAVADPSNPTDCGQSGGQIKDAQDMVAAAATAVAAARDRLSSAGRHLELLEQQAQAEQQAQNAVLVAITAEGKVMQMVAVRQGEERLANEGVQCANTLAQTFQGAGLALVGAGSLPGLPGAGCLPLVNSVAFQDLGDAEAAAQAQTNAQVAIQLGQDQLEDAQMAQQIQTAWADSRTASFEVQEKTQLFDAAVDQVKSLVAELGQALSQARAASRLTGQEAAADPTFRLYRDAAGLAWANDMALARKWAFLATRALEYTLNETAPQEGQAFSAESATELGGLLAALGDAHDEANLTAGWDQDREDTLSLAQDVLGIQGPIVDSVTGDTLTPGQQLQQLLAQPQNRDADGNLRITFSTSVDQGGIFSQDVAVDTLVGVKMSLVGPLAGRTAYVTLTQSGVTRLRGFSGGALVPYVLEPKTALVPAGVNLASPSDTSIPESTDLFERPVDCSGWTLTLDQKGDPRNAAIDLTQLTDLQLFVHHHGRTLQGQ
ncbi:MAG: EB domain-containing protein [Deltaproteobacteria bacterium]